MIYIRKNVTTRFVLELSGLVPTAFQYFTFGFVYEESTNKTIRIFATPDISLNKTRYNEFALVEATNGTTANIIQDIPLNLAEGQYKYYVWASVVPEILPLDFDGYVTTAMQDASISSGRMVVEPFLPTPPVTVYTTIIPNTVSPNVYS